MWVLDPDGRQATETALSTETDAEEDCGYSQTYHPKYMSKFRVILFWFFFVWYI